MRPITLTIRNLRSFRTERTIPFPSAGLFAVVGDTGAGKTSILEAMAYALFNRPTWDGRNVKSLIAKGARTMSVDFTFSVDGRSHTISRITRVTGSPEARLVCEQRGLNVAGVDNVQAAVKEALGMDAETFLHTVLLPQGKHAELLTKAPEKRIGILADIFRLAELEQVDVLARDQQIRAESGLGLLRRQRDDLGPDPSARVRDAGAALQQSLSALESADEALGQSRALNERLLSVKEVTEAESQRLRSLDIVDSALAELSRLATVEAALHVNLIAATGALEAARANDRKASDRIEVLNREGHDAARLRKVDRLLEAFSADLAELEATSATERSELERLAEMGSARTRAKAMIAEALAAAQTADLDLSVQHAHLLDLEAHLASLKAALEDLTRADSGHGQALQLATRLRGDLEIRVASSGTLERDVAEAQRDFDRAVVERESAFIAEGAAALAMHLHAGDACPICATALPQTFRPPTAGGLAATDATLAKATHQRDTLFATKMSLAAEVAALKQRYSDATDILAQASSDVERTQGAVRSLVGKSNDAFALADELTDRAARQRLSVEKARHDVAGRTSDVQNSRVSLASVEASHVQLTKTVAALRVSMTNRLDVLERRETEFPEPFRPGHLGVDVRNVRLRLGEALREAEDAEGTLFAAREAVAEAAVELQGANARLNDQVAVPKASVLGALGAAAELLGERSYAESEEGSAAWIDAVASASLQERHRAQDALTSAEAARFEAAAARARLVEALGGEPEEVRNAALVARTNAEAVLRAEVANASAATTLDERITALEPVRMGLVGLRTTLRSNNFPQFAASQRQRRLLEIASGILGEMVGGRYAFTGEFSILDRASNEVRHPQTLSGGEKFLASLALSLAVVEIAANAGAKIESLFLDEGFDALDSTMLPIAMMELRKRSSGGRVIGVITHVTEAAQFAASTFIVRPTADGSVFEQLDDAIDEDDASVEGLVTQVAGGARA